MTSLSKRFEKAFQYANKVHKGLFRKGTKILYISHLLGVVSIVLQYGGNDDEAIAALLHDAVEDGGGKKRLDEIRTQFGSKVAIIVKECSETMERPKPEWSIRKEQYIAHLAHASKSARLVSAADKLHNVRSLISDYNMIGDKLWKRFNSQKTKQLWFYRSVVDALKKSGSSPIVGELDRT